MITLAALLLAPQPQPAKPRTRSAAARPVAAKPSAEWLKGLWVEHKGSGRPDLSGCASWSALFYRADGTFTHDLHEGVWELKGDKLTQTYFVAESMSDPSLSPWSTPTTSRITRLGRDRMSKAAGKEAARIFARCPKPETPSAR